MIEELEREVNQIAGREERADALYELGQVCEDFLLRKDRAMVHYQASFKLNSQDPKALARARQIYREMGHLEMVATLLGLELKVTPDATKRAEIHAQLGLTQLDLGNVSKAVANLEAALKAKPGDTTLIEAFAAATHDGEHWLEDLGGLTDQALGSEPRRAAELFVRIARILKLEATGDPRIEEALRAALSYDVQHEQANFLLEGLLGEARRFDEVMQLHEERGEAVEDEPARTQLNLQFASTWALRFGDVERAAYFYHKALVASYVNGVDRFAGHLAAFGILRDLLGARGAWEELLQLADLALAGALRDEDAVVIAGQAGLIAWRELGDVTRAYGYFQRVVAVDPASETVREFSDATGAVVTAEVSAGSDESAVAPTTLVPAASAPENDAGEHGRLAVDAVTGPETAIAAAQPATLPAPAPASSEASDARGEVEAQHLAAISESTIAAAHVAVEAEPPAAAEPDHGHGAAAPTVTDLDHPVAKGAPDVTQADVAAGHGELPEPVVAVDSPPAPHAAALSNESAPLHAETAAAPPLVDQEQASPQASLEAAEATPAVVERPLVEAAVDVKAPPAAIAASANGPVPAQGEVSDAHSVAVVMARGISTSHDASSALAAAGPAPSSSEPLPTSQPAHASVAASDEDLPEAVLRAMDTARAAEAGPDKGVDAWKRLVAQNPGLKTPRVEYARVLRAAEKWTLLVEVLKEQAERLPQYGVDEKVATLFTLADVYREKLRLDVMVMNTLNAIIALTPQNRRALDALAGQFEHMKRWPDLIATLQKKAALIVASRADTEGDAAQGQGHATDEDPIAIYSRIASLFQEKFSNAAEAIKAYEKVLELDPGNGAAIAFLKLNYEKRRDWEKLIAVHQREIERMEIEADRAAKYIEVAKLASEKLKKPAVSIDLWAKVLGTSPDHPEALAELEKLYEREKQWDKLAGVLERQAQATAEVAKKVALLSKLGVLFTDRVNDPERATSAWRSLLAVEPENKRAQDALKKLYTTQKRWDDLESFYASQGKFDEYIRVLERQVELEDDATKVVLHTRIAELYRDQLQKPDRAMRAYEKVLSLDARNLAAATALIPLYEAAKDPRKLAGTLEIELEHTPLAEPTLRVERMRRLIELSEEQLHDKAAAFGWARRAFAEAPEETWTRDVTERLAGETGGWTELVAAYETACARLTPETRLPLLMVVARVYEEQLGSAAQALATNANILALDDNNAQAIDALERLYLATQQYPELLSIYEKKLSLETDSAVQKDIRYKIAGLFEEEIKDLDRAVGAYLAILVQNGDELPALRALDRIYVATARWKELADLIPRELPLVDAGDNAAVVEIKFRLARIRERLGDIVGAIECDRDVMEIDPGNAGSREALERLLQDPAQKSHQLVVAAILEPIYLQLGLAEKLVEIHEIQHAQEEDPRSRLALLLRIGELHAQHLGDPKKAFDAYSRGFREDPSDATVRAELERVAAAEDAWGKLVELYLSAIDDFNRRVDSSLLRELLLKVASAFDEKLSQSEKAVEYYRRAQAIEPDDTTALEALEKLYTRHERWADLLETYRRKVDLQSDPIEREAIYFRMASLQEEMLGNADEAIATYKEVLGQDDGNLKALQALDRLYHAKGAWHELADNLQRQLSLTPVEDRVGTVQVLVRLADLREHQLGEVSAAVDTYRQVLELSPDNDDAAGALERLVKIEEHELGVAAILEPIYRARGDWRKLVDVYEIMVRHALDPARKIELYHAIGELYEGGGEADSAFTTYARALKEDPGFGETVAKIERLARVGGRWPDLVALFQGLLESGVLDAGLQVALWTRVAQIHESYLQNDAEAAAAYLRVLSVDPANLDAANALEAIYLHTESYTQLVDVLLHKVEMVQELDEKKGLCFRAAQVYEEVLESPERAIDVYRRVLVIDDNDPTAIEALERLYIKLEQWENLKDIYRKKAELADTVEEKKQVYFVLGQVYDRELRDKVRAIEVYSTVLDLDAQDHQAIQALDRLYGETGRWYELLQILEREVELSGSAAETVGLKYRMGQLFQTQLKDVVRAVEAYREALAIDANHPPTLDALEGIVHGNEEPVLAAHVLEPIYESGRRWQRLVDVYEVMVKHAQDAFQRVELLHRIAELEEQKLSRGTQAFKAHARALREDSTNEATLEQLERLAGQTSAWADLAALYEDQTKKLLDPSRQVEMLLRTARVYEEELAHPRREGSAAATDQAIVTYRRVLDVEPDQKIAILSLDRLYHSSGRFAELSEILRQEIRLAESDDAIIELQFRLGQLFELDLHDQEKAIDVYREILAARPDHEPTRNAMEILFADGVKPVEVAAILEPLYRLSEQWDKLVRIHVAQLDRMTDPQERLAMLQRVAELCEQRLPEQGGVEAAFHYWSVALREAPLSELAGEEVERLGRQLGAWNETVALYGEILEAHVGAQGLPEPAAGDETARALLLKQARIYEEELSDVARAEDANLRVLQIDAKDAIALTALDRIYLASGMGGELATVLVRRIGITQATDDLIELYLRLGAVYSETLDDADQAISAYDAILELDSRNRPALEALERIYLRRESWVALYQVYEKMLDVAAGDEEMADCYARMAGIAGTSFDEVEGRDKARERAIDLWGRVVDLRGEDPTALGNLAALYEAAGAWRELVDILERKIRISPASDEQIAIYSKLGHIWRERLDRDTDSLEAWNQVLALDPVHVEALRAVADIHNVAQSWDDLVQTLHRLIDSGHLDAAEQQATFAELGRIQGELLLRPQEAIEAWRRVLDGSAADARALAALEQLYTQEARWEECIEILERKADAQGDKAERIAVLMQAAEVWEQKVGDQARAAAEYERVLGMESTNLAASTALENIYRSVGNWEKCNELLLARTEFVPERERVELFQAMAQVYERELNDRDGAFVVLQAAFQGDYANAVTARELERIATLTNKWAELVGEYTQVVQTITDPKMAADLWVKIGRWYGEHLGRLDYAVASEKQALALDPNHREALTQLAEVYRKTQQWRELSDVLARHAALEEDPQKRVELHLSIADLFEGQLGDPGQAVRAYREAVNADPACVDGLNALERLYRKDGKWAELIDVLGRKASVVDEPDEVIALRHQIGALQDERLGDAGRAISTYKDILVADSQNVAAMKALERLYDKSGQMEAYLELLDRELDVTVSDDERVAIYERQAHAWEDKFHRLDRASEVLEKLLLIDERHGGALRWLERLYRQERRSSDLVDTLRRHISGTPDQATRIDLYAEMGEVYETELKDLDRAIEAYSDILAFDPDHTGALASLGRLYEKIEDWPRAMDAMQRTVELTSDAKLKVELHHRMGRVHEERIGDPDSAEQHFVEALSIDPGHLPSMSSLTALYVQRGDSQKAAQMMVRAEAFAANPVEKVKLLHEAGRIFRSHLDDEQKAAELFIRVLEIDPEHVESAEPLAELWFRESEAGTERWAQLEPVLDMLVRKADRRNNVDLNQLYYRLARTADALGNAEKALKFYKLAYELDSTYLPTLLGRAALLYKQQDWEGAFKIYQTILVHHGDGQSGDDTIETYFRLGMIKVKQGDRTKALNFFEKALELDPSHRPTLGQVIELQTTAGEWEAVATAKRALMPVSDEAERFRLYEEIGDLYHEKAQLPQKAISSYSEALDIRADNHQVLHKVLELYIETQQWQSAVDTLQRFAEMETKNPVFRGKYFEAAAKILRDELKHNDDAIDYFNRALDGFFENQEALSPQTVPTYLKAFEAIDRIVSSGKDWKTQERSYRKMIKRLPQQGFEPIKIALWHALGEIYRSRLKDYPSAISSFEVANTLDPMNVQRREILAELYVLSGPETAYKAVGEHVILLNQDPFRLESYRALRKLYMDLRQYDRAWCMCNALVFLQRADAEETAFFEQYRQKGFIRAKQPISDDMWARLLMHPDEDRFVGAIFASIWQAVALIKSLEHKKYEIKRKDKLDLATHQALFSKVFSYVAQVLNVALPEVYLRQDRAGSLQLLNLKEKNLLLPSVVVFGELLQGRSDKELAFPVARFLTLMRPEHYLKLTLPTNAELRVAFLAALKLVMPTFPIPPAEAASVEQYVIAMKQVLMAQPAMVEQLGLMVQRFVSTKAEINLNKWSQAAELTAHRAAFVVCNDLGLAARFVQSEPTVVNGLTPKDKVKELVMYAISEQYFELRQQLGITIS